MELNNYEPQQEQSGAAAWLRGRQKPPEPNAAPDWMSGEGELTDDDLEQVAGGKCVRFTDSLGCSHQGHGH
ncbi:MAG TPA: hypothetical protein VM536_00785 [Chloroflexia bacterium]|nr:hypothetical protein [Chloroflexia bacterium]